MVDYNFITVRLGKDSIADIDKISSMDTGIQSNNAVINVSCTQVPDNYKAGDIAFIWFGSDNNKGAPTKWKQGFKAIGRVTNIERGIGYNDVSTTTIAILYIFEDSINRLDILRCAPTAYYWCSSLPLIGLDDHANQTIRNMSGNNFSEIGAFFIAIQRVVSTFRRDITKIEPSLDNYFKYSIPFPEKYPSAKNFSELELTQNKQNDSSLQQIFYGAPGTGKSHTIKLVTDNQPKENVFRTTFHPDSDYSTFVGCYKPSMYNPTKRERLDLSMEDLAKELNGYYNDNELGKIGGLQKFCLEFHKYIDGEYMSVNVTKLLEKAGIPETYSVEINKYLKFCQMLPKHDDSRIVYKYTPQAFTKAYLQAWQTTEPVYLIIEEINRGNCAQIFGDLFQLLDRKDGVSEYPIKPDTDLGNYIAENLKAPVDGCPAEIRNGEEISLPSNLYIWATMNTSDQSLFPIDSAFKRRWDWEYMPIEDAGKNWKIAVNGHEYDWYGFLQAINNEVLDLTHSEDKQLGYFFAKAKDNKIDAKTLVNKVYFYLWTDVFKDYDYESLKSFRKADGNGAMAFKDFFKNGEVDESMAEQVIINLGLDKPTGTAE